MAFCAPITRQLHLVLLPSFLTHLVQWWKLGWIISINSRSYHRARWLWNIAAVKICFRFIHRCIYFCNFTKTGYVSIDKVFRLIDKQNLILWQGQDDKFLRYSMAYTQYHIYLYGSFRSSRNTPIRIVNEHLSACLDLGTDQKPNLCHQVSPIQISPVF